MRNLTFTFLGNTITSDEYNETYGKLNDYAGEAKLIVKIAMNYNNKKNIRIMDVGCGTGQLLSEIENSCNSHKIKGIGVDIHPDFIEYAINRNLKNSTFILHNVFDLSFPFNTFDLVLISTYLIQTAPDYHSFKFLVNQLSDWLPTSGVLIFSFIDYNLYSKKYNDGTFEINLYKNNWVAEGFTQNQPSLSRRFFQLSFTNIHSKVSFGSQAYYLDLSTSNLQDLFEKEFVLDFVNGKNIGIKDDGCRVWAILKKRGKKNL